MKDIVGFEGLYAVTMDGRVWSHAKEWISGKKGGRKCKHSGQFLSACDRGIGYFVVRLSKNGKNKMFYVHKLVAEAYIPNPLGFVEVNHKNSLKWDNRAENLEWCTRSENMRQMWASGIRG